MKIGRSEGDTAAVVSDYRIAVTDLTWAKMLDDYEAAVRRHEALSRAVTEALLARSDGAELQRLEAEAKDTARLARTRLIDFFLGDDHAC